MANSTQEAREPEEVNELAEPARNGGEMEKSTCVESLEEAYDYRNNLDKLDFTIKARGCEWRVNYETIAQQSGFFRGLARFEEGMTRTVTLDEDPFEVETFLIYCYRSSLNFRSTVSYAPYREHKGAQEYSDDEHDCWEIWVKCALCIFADKYCADQIQDAARGAIISILTRRRRRVLVFDDSKYGIMKMACANNQTGLWDIIVDSRCFFALA